MKFLLGKSDTMSKPIFLITKNLLSVLSVVLTIAFVFVLEARV